MARVGQQAPEFETIALVGDDFKNIKLSDYKGKYHVLHTFSFLVILIGLIYATQENTWYCSSIL